MNGSVEVPLWLFSVLLVGAAWALLDRLLVPSVRWFFRRRANRAIDEINSRLHIRLQPFKLTKRQVLVERLIYDPVVLEAGEEFGRSEGLPREVVGERIQRYAEEIVPSFNAYVYFRFGYWLSKRLAQLLYRVRIGWSDDDGLAGVPPCSTIVFVMNHRSNMDYVLVAYLAAEKTALSYAVGEWARVWPLQALIQAMGAYFVRRRSGKPLYRTVLQRYVHMATSAGVTQAVYPEGGLSRDGRLRAPKLGILDYMLRGFDPEGERDLVFVPVGINYDRCLEDRTLLLEEPGAPPTTLAAIGGTLRFIGHNIWLGLRSRWYRFGYACVNFGPPVSMKDYCHSRELDFRALERDARFAHIADLAANLMTEIGSVIPAVPVSLVATVLVRDPSSSMTELELKARVLLLVEALEASGAHVFTARENLDYTIVAGLRMLTLRRLVSSERGRFSPIPDQMAVLEYYANSIAHLLV